MISYETNSKNKQRIIYDSYQELIKKNNLIKSLSKEDKEIFLINLTETTINSKLMKDSDSKIIFNTINNVFEAYYLFFNKNLNRVNCPELIYVVLSNFKVIEDFGKRTKDLTINRILAQLNICTTIEIAIRSAVTMKCFHENLIFQLSLFERELENSCYEIKY